MNGDELRREFEALGRLLTERAPAPITVDRATAASMLSMSVDSLERYVLPHVRIVRRGKLRLIPVAELERWADANAEHIFPHGEGRLTGRPSPASQPNGRRQRPERK